MNITSPFRALVVDDEPSVRQAVIRALSQSGFSCDAADNGRAAMELINQSRFDVVVTDLRMPEVNGHKLAADLLDLPSRPAVVILTGVLEPKLSDDLWARGVDDIQYKPVNFGLLSLRIRRIIEQRRRAALPNEKDVSNEAAVDDADIKESTFSPAAEVKSGQKKTGRMAKNTNTSAANTFNARDLATAFEKLHRSLLAKQQRTTIQCIVLFAAGLFAGWFLSLFGPVVRLWR